MTFLNSILNNSKKHNDPFVHWELNQPLSEQSITEIINDSNTITCSHAKVAVPIQTGYGSIYARNIVLSQNSFSCINTTSVCDGTIQCKY